jgi:hypothetical protein
MSTMEAGLFEPRFHSPVHGGARAAQKATGMIPARTADGARNGQLVSSDEQEACGTLVGGLIRLPNLIRRIHSQTQGVGHKTTSLILLS